MTTEAIAPAPAQTPERAAAIRDQVSRTVAWLTGAALEGLAASTDSGSPAPAQSMTERALWRVLRPLIPKLRQVVLERLEATDPASLEQLLSATSFVADGILAGAPDVPLERCALVADELGRPRLVTYG